MISIIPYPNYIEEKNSIVTIKKFKLITDGALQESLWKFQDEFTRFIDDEATFKIVLSIDDRLCLEEYTLEITDDFISITSSSPKGAFYALTTLKQLITLDDDALVINKVIIKDKPKLNFRSFSLDESRHFFGKEEVKRILDVLSQLKFNYFHWHLSDDQGFRINLKKFPNLQKIGSKRKGTKINNEFGSDYDDTVYQAWYEEEEILEIIEYAKKRYISIIPEVDLPGHTGSIVASYPHLHCFNKQIEVFDKIAGFKDIICVGKDSTYNFIEELLMEVLRIFKDSEYFHLGGDEVIPTNWETCPDCQLLAQKLDVSEASQLQEYFTNRILDECLLKSGKKIIMWHDGIKSKTHPSVILQYWTWRMDKEAIDIINNGRKTIYSPCCQAYFDAPYAELPLKDTYGRKIKLDGLTSSGHNSIFGYECCVWTEFIRENNLLEFMIFPRIHAMSEASWMMDSKLDYDSFLERLDSYYNWLDNNGYKYASKSIVDIKDPNEEISKEFRNVTRYVEYDLDRKNRIGE